MEGLHIVNLRVTKQKNNDEKKQKKSVLILANLFSPMSFLLIDKFSQVEINVRTPSIHH